MDIKRGLGYTVWGITMDSHIIPNGKGQVLCLVPDIYLTSYWTPTERRKWYQHYMCAIHCIQNAPIACR